MNRRRGLWVSLASIVLSGVLVYGIYVVQIRQAEFAQTIGVVVPKQFMRAGVTVTEEMVELKPIFRASFEEDMYTSVAQVAGQETLIPIGKGEPITAWKIDKLRLYPSEREATFQIPKTYIMSISNGIRAGDKVQIYISDPSKESRRLFPHDIVVASVKSASNVEIDDPDQPGLLAKAKGNMEKVYAARRDANGAIDQINLNLTEEEWLAIDRACKSQTTKLIIAFASSSVIGEKEDKP